MQRLDVLFVNCHSAPEVYQELSKNNIVSIEPPFWAGLLASFMRKRNYSVDILDAEALGLTHENTAKQIIDINATLTVFVVYGHQPSASTQCMTSAISVHSMVKESNADLQTMFMGTHSSALPEQTLDETNCNFVCYGEGPSTVLGIIECIKNKSTDFSKVPSLCYRDSSICKTERGSLIKSLDDELPSVAWDLLPMDKYRASNWHCIQEKDRQPYASLYTSLGCPFSCSFCLDENTNIIVSNGKNKKIKDVTKKDKLVAFDTVSGQVVETNIVEISKREVTNILKIELCDGKHLLVTGEHPLYCNGKWVEAKSLKTGDQLLVIDPNDKISLFAKMYNSMKGIDARNKVSRYWKKKFKDGYKNKLFEKDFQRKYRCKDDEKIKKMREDSSRRMSENNPMKHDDVRNKVSETHKKKFQSGEITHFFCTEKGKKIISEIAKRRATEDNPMWKLTDEQKNKLSKIRSENAKRLWSDENYRHEQAKSGNCYIVQGEDRVQWKGGKSFETYGIEFNKKLRLAIRERDNFTCQVCMKTMDKLQVHHIDYNKKNNDPCNLISLCSSCHPKTNFNRPEYEKMFVDKMKEKGQCPHYIEVKAITEIPGKRTVYNFQCAPYDNYFAEYVLTHNCCINKPFGRSTIRYLSPEVAIREIDVLVNKYSVRHIKIPDEMFVLHRHHVVGICDEIINRGYDLNIWAYARIDTIQDDFLEKLKMAGFNWLALGIESANSKVRDGQMKKLDDEDIVNTVKKIREHGINVIGNYIFGLPGDTFSTMQDTLDLALSLNTEWVNFYSAMAFPGSPLHTKCVLNREPLPETHGPGWIGYSQHSADTFPMRTEHLTNGDVLKFRDHAHVVYFTDENYLSMIESKFGKNDRDYVEKCNSFQLKRNYT